MALEIKPQPNVTVFQRRDYSPLKSYLALVLWPGMIHFTFILIFVSILMLPSLFSLITLGLMVFLALIPLKGNKRLGRFIVKYCCGYFPMRVHVEDLDKFDPNEAYVFAYIPHGVVGVGVVALSNLAELLPFKKVKVMGASAALSIPLVRQMWSSMDFVHATKQNFVSSLEKSYTCVVVPGGVSETLYIQRDIETVLLKQRKGFVRVAMETGKPLVPIFAFGQGQIYKWWRPSKRVGTWFYNVTKLPAILSWGVFGPIPSRRPIDIVVGKPMIVKRNLKPTREEVDEVHEKFVETLQDMFERHKARVGFPDTQLRVV